MFQQLRKYRNFLAIGIMGFYLAGGLQFSMLECLHFLTHVNDLATGNYDSHSFHSHDGSHEHLTLAALDGFDESDHNQNIPVNETSDLSAKKFPQFFYILNNRPSLILRSSQLIFAKANRLNGLPLSIPSPPPRLWSYSFWSVLISNKHWHIHKLLINSLL